MNKYKFQLISSLIYVIFTVSTLTGQSCDGLAGHINNQTLDVITEPGVGTSNEIYSSYSSTGNSAWAEQNWTGQIDFSGVAFDRNETFTLISPRHVLMATHYQRGIGSTVVFHDSDGVRHSATLIASQSVPGGTNPDITVGLLDVDVPVKYYKVLLQDADWITYLEDALVVSTHHTRDASIREINYTSGKYIGFKQSSSVPTSYYAPAVSGNSGNPSFLLINEDPVLISTFTFGGAGSGPFFSEPSNFNAINSIMTSLGGGHQLETVDACALVSPPVCNSAIHFVDPNQRAIAAKYGQFAKDQYIKNYVEAEKAYIKYHSEIHRIINAKDARYSKVNEDFNKIKDIGMTMLFQSFVSKSPVTVTIENLRILDNFLVSLSEATSKNKLRDAITKVRRYLHVMENKEIKDALVAFDRAGEDDISGFGTSSPFVSDVFDSQIFNAAQIISILSYELSERGRVDIKMYDTNGRLMKVIPSMLYEAGIYTEIFDKSNLTSGMYFIHVKFTAETGLTSDKVLKLPVMK